MKLLLQAKPIVLFSLVLCMTGTSVVGWMGFIDAITAVIEGAVSGQATKIEQVTQIKHQVSQLSQLQKQTEALIKNSKRYNGDNAWRAAHEIRSLASRLRAVHENGKHIAADAHDTASRVLTVLPTDEDFHKARTAAERAEWNMQQELASRDALRDSLRATITTSQAIHAHLDDASNDVARIARDLSHTDSQLAALQLIGDANTQTLAHLQVLTKAIVSQTDLLTNLYAREVAAEDRHRGLNTREARTKLVPSHQVDDYRAAGHTVKPAPAALESLLRD